MFTSVCSTWSIEIPWLNPATGLSASAESVKRPSLRRNSSREKQRLHRSSSRRNKENGAKGGVRSAAAAAADVSRSLEAIKSVKIVRVTVDQQQQQQQQLAAEKMLDNSYNEIIEEQTVRVPSRTGGDSIIGPQDCTEMDVKTFHVTLTYKPRI